MAARFRIRRQVVLLSILVLSAGFWMFSAGSPLQRGTIRERIQQRAGQRPVKRGQRALPKQTLKMAGLDVAVWTPSVRTGAKLPLILFSHGLHGCNTQSTFLMAAFAEAGYLVIAPNHNDAICGGGLKTFPSARPEESLTHPGSWSDKTYRDRRDDISKLVDALRRDSKWSNQIDWSRVALAGHSLGGYTVLGLAGAWRTWKLPDIKAVLALSPYCEPFVMNGNLGAIEIPVMYQGGTRDLGITPSVKRPGGCFAKTSSPEIFVEFDAAGHFAWTDLQSTAHDQIAAYSVGFLDKYVRGVSTADAAVKGPGVTIVRVK